MDHTVAAAPGADKNFSFIYKHNFPQPGVGNNRRLQPRHVKRGQIVSSKFD
jgi:hypothetical protein